MSNKEDNIVWCAAKSGRYSIKLGYQLSGKVIDSNVWPHKLCWNKLFLPKFGAFSWLVLKV